MSAPGSTPAPPLSRRAAYRQATIEEIKTLARRQLAEHGPGALSLRAIARQMRTASSALYRYFASQDDLLGALCVDAYASLADRLTAARDDRPGDDPTAQMWAICHVYRRWARDDTVDFALIFGTPVPGYQAPDQLTGPAAGRATAVLLDTYAAAVAAGAADLARTQVPSSLTVGELLPTLVGDITSPDRSRLVGVALNAFASLRGYVTSEIFGSLARLVTDTDALYRAHVRTVMLGMGFDRVLVDTVASQSDPGMSFR